MFIGVLLGMGTYSPCNTVTVYGMVWGRFFLLDQVRGQWDFIRTKAEFKAFAESHRGWREIRVEAKANGEATPPVP